MDISTLSLSEEALIKATYYYYTEKQFKCKIREREEAERAGGIEKARLRIQTANGCNVISKEPKYQIDRFNFHTCFCNFIYPDFNYFSMLYGQYEKGNLPYPGSMSEQPNKVIEIFNVLDLLNIERQEKLHKEHEKSLGRR